MFNEESYFNPLEAEAVIDSAYDRSERLPERFQKDYEGAIKMVEDIVYAVTEDGEFTAKELERADKGLELLDKVENYLRPEYDPVIRETYEELDNLKGIVTNQGTEVEVEEKQQCP